MGLSFYVSSASIWPSSSGWESAPQCSRCCHRGGRRDDPRRPHREDPDGAAQRAVCDPRSGRRSDHRGRDAHGLVRIARCMRGRGGVLRDPNARRPLRTERTGPAGWRRPRIRFCPFRSTAAVFGRVVPRSFGERGTVSASPKAPAAGAHNHVWKARVASRLRESFCLFPLPSSGYISSEAHHKQSPLDLSVLQLRRLSSLSKFLAEARKT